MTKGKEEDKHKALRKRVLLIATLIVVMPIVYVTCKNIVHSISISRSISAIEDEAKSYQMSISQDSLLLQQIKYDEGLERYAREKFFMQRSGERVYVIE